MSLRDTAIMSMIGDKGRWLIQRQRVVGQNIANANTPGYQARDLKPLNFRDSLRDASRTFEIAAPSSGKAFSIRQSADEFRVERGRTTYEISPDQNEIVLEEQVIKMNQIQADYQLALNLRRKFGELYNTALGGGGQGGS